MNRERMRKLAKTIRASTTFDQSTWTHGCGSPACIAGHAAGMALGEGEQLAAAGAVIDQEGRIVSDVPEAAQGWLELTDEQAEYLFHPYAFGWPEDFERRHQQAIGSFARAQIAADLLEALADGRVTLDS